MLRIQMKQNNQYLIKKHEKFGLEKHEDPNGFI